MSKITIDAVLLPDEEMTNKVVEISERQSKKFNEKIVLNKEKCLPHISLAMGAIENKDLVKAKERLSKIANNYKKFNLVADTYHGDTIPSGDIVSEFTVEKNPELKFLHEEIMTKLKPYLFYNNLSIDMVYSPPKVEKITLHWIKNYAKKSSFEKFNPHITIGFGELDNIKTPINFTSSKLALCHLGNYCTCRKVLFSKELTK